MATANGFIYVLKNQLVFPKNISIRTVRTCYQSVLILHGGPQVLWTWLCQGLFLSIKFCLLYCLKWGVYWNTSLSATYMRICLHWEQFPESRHQPRSQTPHWWCAARERGKEHNLHKEAGFCFCFLRIHMVCVNSEKSLCTLMLPSVKWSIHIR